MRIGIDARKVNRDIRTGIEEYSFHLIKNLLELDSRNQYTFYFDRSPGEKIRRELLLERATNVVVPFSGSAVIWVTLALPVQMQLTPCKPDVLFMPVHYIPPISPVRVVFTAFDAVFDHFGIVNRTAHATLLRVASRRAQGIIAISHATKDDLTKKLGVAPEKISVVYLGYDDQSFHSHYTQVEKTELATKYRLDEDFILYCGTLQPRKNIARLVEAYSLLVERDGIPQRLVIAGKQGWGLHEIYQRVQQLHLEERVIFTGYVSTRELALLMNSAALFVFPSLYEGFGIPLLEAMACGAPVVTSNISSMPEVVGDAAVLVDPYSVQQLADAMEQVLGNPGLQLELKEKGMVRVKQFSWRKTAEQILQVFERLGGKLT